MRKVATALFLTALCGCDSTATNSPLAAPPPVNKPVSNAPATSQSGDSGQPMAESQGFGIATDQ